MLSSNRRLRFRRRFLGAGVLLLGLALAAGTAAATARPAAGPAAVTPTAYAAPNNDPAFLQVYVNNTENLPKTSYTCPGDWQDLYYYMRLQKLRPDLFIVQQASKENLATLTGKLKAELGESYKWVISETDPRLDVRKCGPPKYYQPNAIVYRTARFDVKRTADGTWRSDAGASASDCKNNVQSRTVNVKAMLYDKIAKKDVTVGSMHWPTGKSDGPVCAEENAREAAAEMKSDGYSGALRILGGDANIGDLSGTAYRPWFKDMNGDLGGKYGYRDAIYAACASAGGSIPECLKKNRTLGERRIDFLFAQKGDGTLPKIDGQQTVWFNDGDAADKQVTGTDDPDHHYSDHRSVSARIHY